MSDAARIAARLSTRNAGHLCRLGSHSELCLAFTVAKVLQREGIATVRCYERDNGALTSITPLGREVVGLLGGARW